MENLYLKYQTIIWASALAFTVAFVAIPLVIYFSKKKNLLDKPDHRKQHKAPIPTMGGLGIFAGLAASSLVWLQLITPREGFSLAIAIIMLLVTGVVDDLKGVSAGKRFLIQLFAGVISVQAGFVFHFPAGFLGIYHFPIYFEYVFTIFLIAGVTNSFNLIDGIDGLAGGIGFINAILFGFLFIYFDNIPFATLAFAFAFSLLAFLKYNFNPASIFMGDTGSLVLGYLMVNFSLKLIGISQSSLKNNTFILIVFALLLIPVIDTLRVFLFRALKKKSPFSADRTHIHHLLLKTGFNHKKASFILYGANVLLILESFALHGIRLEFAIAILLVSAVLLIEILSVVRLVKTKSKISTLYYNYKVKSIDNQLLLRYLNERKIYAKR